MKGTLNMVDYLLHFYRIGADPFRSLSSLSDENAMERMRELYIEGSIFWERFKDPHDYLQFRKGIESWMYREFKAKGGDPKETYPIYLVLGRPKWTVQAVDSVTLATTNEVQVPLSIFTERDISFTYPDSMVSTFLANDKPAEYYLPDYHGKIFTLSEIRSIVERNGLPGEGWDTILPSRLANYIEAQVWNHKLLRDYFQLTKPAEPPAPQSMDAS